MTKGGECFRYRTEPIGSLERDLQDRQPKRTDPRLITNVVALRLRLERCQQFAEGLLVNIAEIDEQEWWGNRAHVAGRRCVSENVRPSRQIALTQFTNARSRRVADVIQQSPGHPVVVE